ncbi:hypothetical protein [Streptomyces sp. NPDC051214]|uniref:hypothetical protein n=1 Tax=Streptomyces sp. NPDC051214 TaxID=3155282 RepID=UPI00344AF489
MSTHDWRRPARRRTTVRRAGILLCLACLLLAVIATALAPAVPPARPVPAAAPGARDGRAPVHGAPEVCAALTGPVQEHCRRTMRTVAGPRAASAGQDVPCWVLAPAAAALLALVAMRRRGRPEPS